MVPQKKLKKSVTKTYDTDQWRSQKFVMEGVQNRGLVGTG